MTEAFDASSRYYDLLYRDKDYQTETKYLLNLLDRESPGFTTNPKPRSVLELGCGTGGHAMWLTRHGFNVMGVDLNQKMLERAGSRFADTTHASAGKFDPCLSDVRSFQTDHKFDAVASLFHVASYQITNSDIKSFFRTASNHLEKNGIFVFDAWYGPAVLTQIPVTRVKRVADERINVVRIAEPTLFERENKVEVRYTIFVTDRESQNTQRLDETHSMRYFFEPEIRELASQQGFEITSQEEWMTGEMPSKATWGVVFTARKQD